MKKKKISCNALLLLCITSILSWSVWTTTNSFSVMRIDKSFERHVSIDETRRKEFDEAIKDLKTVMEESNRRLCDKLDSNIEKTSKNIQECYKILIEISKGKTK